ncbi:lytic transglycosylase domain-containing protein [Streptomyces longwoodensis]|uniref:lytic transglycosylase domain-containing protein n=1 Tax=Streptomyces longwoodensis TaxID=68231 RepID=UPI0030DF20EA|nr:lytic transglycosylase domain-containing protein [Streptomyces longwoodensis]
MAAHFGRRLRKGAVTTAVAAAAVAALSASQAPDVTTTDGQERQSAADAQATPDPTAADAGATGNSPYYTDLPPLNSPTPVPSTTVGPTTGTGTTSQAGIPATVLDAYQRAAAELTASKPGCNLPWQLLAAIGQVESGQARGGRVTADGTTVSPILGPVLNGVGFAHIKDTDHGAYDGDATYDRAIGPLQFIPSTWAWAGRDGNGDGKADPNNVYDAALAAGHYLCRNGWDLSVEADLKKAILSYNYSQDYLHTVRSWMEFYRRGTHEIPDGSGSLPGNRSDEHDTPMSPSVPVTPSPAPKPSKPGGTTKPSTPATPSKPGTPSTPSTPTPSPTPTPTPTDTVAHIEDAGTATLSARAGDTFADRISARAETSSGKPVAKVRIRFTIVGDTDAAFAGGESHATVVTDAKGVALAPALRAGEKTGDFTVRALLVGRAVTAVDYRATVTARAADALTRTGDTALTCTAGGELADRVEVKATYKGAAAGKVAATATLVASADATTANDKGPYFKDASGKPVRTLTGLETDASGLLKLPELYADDTTGTFVLRVTTTGGATLTVELTVTAPASSTPTPSDSPSPSQSPAASESPSA